MKAIKNLIKKFFFCGQKIWYRKWMERFTTTVLILLLFNIPFILMLVAFHLKFGLSTAYCKMMTEYYLSFSKILISAYAVTFVGAMTKELAAKKAEEDIKLQRDSMENIDTEDNVEVDEEN